MVYNFTVSCTRQYKVSFQFQVEKMTDGIEGTVKQFVQKLIYTAQIKYF